MTKTRTKSCTNHCRSCGRHFSSVSAFDAHRQGEYGLPKHSLEGRRCTGPEHIEKPALEVVSGACAIANPGEPLGEVEIWRERVSPDARERLAALAGER